MKLQMADFMDKYMQLNDKMEVDHQEYFDCSDSDDEDPDLNVVL